MPDIMEISRKKKKFSKTSYRAWNFSEKNDDDKQEAYTNASIKPSSDNKVIDPQSRATEQPNRTKKKAKKQVTKANNTTPETASQGNNPLATREQDVSKALARREQPVSDPLATREQDVSKALARREQPVSDPLATREQDVSKALANPLAAREQPVSSPLAENKKEVCIPPAGKELDLLLFLCSICVKNCSLTTPEITTKELNNHLNIRSNRLRNLILRISQKKLITVVSQNCSGTSAYRVFQFSKDVYDKVLCKLNTNNTPHESNSPLANPLATPPVVSSSSYINTITTTEEVESDSTGLPDEWANIDTSELTTEGFGRNHLIQIYRAFVKNPQEGFDAQMVQDSINQLGFDLKHHREKLNFKMSPVALLTSLLKRGSPYSSVAPNEYMPPRELAMRRYLEQARQREQARIEIETQLRDIEFENWNSLLSDPEIVELIGQDQVNSLNRLNPTNRASGIKGLLREHFTKNIWPDKQRAVMLTVRED